MALCIPIYLLKTGISDRKWILAAKSSCTTLISSLSGGVFAVLYRYVQNNTLEFSQILDTVWFSQNAEVRKIFYKLLNCSLYVTDGKLDILMIINGILGALVGK